MKRRNKTATNLRPHRKGQSQTPKTCLLSTWQFGSTEEVGNRFALRMA